MRRYTVHVEVETHGGETFHGTAADRPGSPALPLSDDELTAKFLGLAAPVVGDEAAARIAELVARWRTAGRHGRADGAAPHARLREIVLECAQ